MPMAPALAHLAPAIPSDRRRRQQSHSPKSNVSKQPSSPTPDPPAVFLACDSFQVAAAKVAVLKGDQILHVLAGTSQAVVFKTLVKGASQPFIVKVFKLSPEQLAAKTNPCLEVLRHLSSLPAPLSPGLEFVAQRVPKCYGSWISGDMLAIRKEWLSGRSLNSILASSWPVGFSEAHYLHTFYELVTFLHHLHNDCGIIHRDVKPENIIVRPNGKIALIDWDSASFLQPGHFLSDPWGSWAYASPEVYLRKPYNHQADIWSASVILFLLATHTLPFTTVSGQIPPEFLDGPSAPASLSIPPTVPFWLCKLLSQLLHTNFSSRLTSS
ncbi:MAG: protein kinase, partial [archaeon]|nr:protein kinase [archaeon]